MADLAIPGDLEFMSCVDVTGLGDEPRGVGDVTGIAAAIASAKEHGLSCYLTEGGEPVVAIVPVRRHAPAPG
jgi:hypothetical protein